MARLLGAQHLASLRDHQHNQLRAQIARVSSRDQQQLLSDPEWARHPLHEGGWGLEQTCLTKQRSREQRFDLRYRQCVEVADAGQPDLGAQPETPAERETMFGQPDSTGVFRDERPPNVVREVVTRIEPEYYPAGPHARAVTPKREHLLVRSVRRDREVDDLETSVGQEALQIPPEHRSVRLFVADLEPFRLTVSNEQDPRHTRCGARIGNRTAKAPSVVGHVDGVLVLLRVEEAGEWAIDEVELVVELDMLERLRSHESDADLGEERRHDDTEGEGDETACDGSHAHCLAVLSPVAVMIGQPVSSTLRTGHECQPILSRWSHRRDRKSGVVG